MIVSAYDNNDKIVEGKLFVTPTGNKVVLTENGHTNLNELKCVRLLEDEKKEAVTAKVEDDLSHCDQDKLKNTSDEDLKKAGAEREKELKDAGMEMEDNEYAMQFVAGAKAKTEIEDVEAGNISNSKALEKVSESEATIYNNLSDDYQDVMPYQDDKTRNEIYLDMQKEIEDYSKDTKKFDNEELSERLCNKFLNGKQVRGESLKETFKLIVRNYR